MTRRTLWSTILIILVIAGCGPGEVIVTSEAERPDPDTGERVMAPIEGMEVQLVPFDRDAIFDSLAQETATPEPQLPADLAVARDSIQETQRIFREAENRVLAIREQLIEINEEMEQYNPAEARYRELFSQFNSLEAELVEAEATRDEYFERFTELQSETFAALDSVRIQIENWEDQAFAEYGLVVEERLRETRREILADTTDATGRARFTPDPGEWWVYARHERAIEELYWNIRVDVQREEPVEVHLTRENAEIREVF